MNGKSSLLYRIGLATLVTAPALATAGAILVWASDLDPVSFSAGPTLPAASEMITGSVYYTGTVTGIHMVWVGAFTTTQGGPPAYSTMLSGAGSYTLALSAGNYYVGGGMDADDSGGPPDPMIDPMGFYANNPVTVTMGSVITGVDFVLLDPMSPPTDTGSISGWITYTGAISSDHNIIVFVGRWGEPGPPAYSTVIFGPGPFTITHMIDYTYTVGAFMDRDGDMGPPEPDEPWGWYDLGGDKNPDPVIVSAGGPVTGINVTLRDPYSICLPLVLRGSG